MERGKIACHKSLSLIAHPDAVYSTYIAYGNLFLVRKRFHSLNDIYNEKIKGLLFCSSPRVYTLLELKQAMLLLMLGSYSILLLFSTYLDDERSNC
jgi:hypothetical protein